jgi:hypothetical protein
MTREEYLEFIQENLLFPSPGTIVDDPGQVLYDHDEIVNELRDLHEQYCAMIEHTLFPERCSRFEAFLEWCYGLRWRFEWKVRRLLENRAWRKEDR